MSGPYDDFPKLGDFDILAGEGVCDFCSPPQPSAWIYPCKTFELPLPPGLTKEMLGGRHAMSDGDWGACLDCAALIERADAIGLAQRCGKDGEIFNWQKRIVQRFFDNRLFDRPRRNVEGQANVLFPKPIIRDAGPWSRKPE